jgi:hypothetical protein
MSKKYFSVFGQPAKEFKSIIERGLAYIAGC